MIYNHENVLTSTSVFDVDAVSKIDQVISIDTEAGELVCAHQPLRVRAGEVDTFTIKFKSIYAISGGSPWPCLFHCYGRQA